jgi:hypothetical protein
MKFNPGQTRKVVGGVAYIKDIPKVQVSPPVIEPKVEPIQEIKPEKNELQYKQMDEKPVLDGSRTSGKSSSTNKSSTSGESRI